VSVDATGLCAVMAATGILIAIVFVLHLQSKQACNTEQLYVAAMVYVG
jgi:hypothetical protein